MNCVKMFVSPLSTRFEDWTCICNGSQLHKMRHPKYHQLLIIQQAFSWGRAKTLAYMTKLYWRADSCWTIRNGENTQVWQENWINKHSFRSFLVGPLLPQEGKLVVKDLLLGNRQVDVSWVFFDNPVKLSHVSHVFLKPSLSYPKVLWPGWKNLVQLPKWGI